MPNIVRLGGGGSTRKNSVNTVFLNNFNSTVNDYNDAKSSSFANAMIVDGTKTVGGFPTTRILFNWVLNIIYTFQENLSQWTIEYWIFPTSYGGSYRWFSLLNSSGGTELILNQSGANVYTEWTGTGGNQVFANPSNNTAHHVAVTYNNGSIQLFFDGTLRNTFSKTINTSNASLVLTPAQSSSTNIFGMRISRTVRYTSNFTPTTNLLSVD